MKFVPIGNKILVELQEKLEETKKGGIIIPVTAQQSKPRKATIKSLGTGKRTQNGTLVPFEVKAGDTVMVSLYGGIKLDDDVDSTLLLIEEEDILAKLEEE